MIFQRYSASIVLKTVPVVQHRQKYAYWPSMTPRSLPFAHFSVSKKQTDLVLNIDVRDTNISRVAYFWHILQPFCRSGRFSQSFCRFRFLFFLPWAVSDVILHQSSMPFSPTAFRAWDSTQNIHMSRCSIAFPIFICRPFIQFIETGKRSSVALNFHWCYDSGHSARSKPHIKPMKLSTNIVVTNYIRDGNSC